MLVIFPSAVVYSVTVPPVVIFPIFKRISICEPQIPVRACCDTCQIAARWHFVFGDTTSGGYLSYLPGTIIGEPQITIGSICNTVWIATVNWEWVFVLPTCRLILICYSISRHSAFLLSGYPKLRPPSVGSVNLTLV